MDHRQRPQNMTSSTVKTPPTTIKTTATPPAFPHIPDEILLNILPRLPIKTLIRFRTVCKRWRHLLSGVDPEINHLHLLFHHHRCSTYLLRHHNHNHRNRHSFSLIASDRIRNPNSPNLTSSSPYNRLSPPHPRISEVVTTAHNEGHVDLEVVGSTIGLFCLAYNRGTCVVVWNPTTRDWFQLPDPNVPSFGFSITSFGFASGVGDNVGNYKVVRVVYGRDEQFRPGFHRNKWRVNAEVYDSCSNYWKEIVNPPRMEFSATRCGVIVKGVPCWPADQSECAKLSSNTIISFDPVHNKFVTFKRPNIDPDEVDSCFSWRLGEVRGSLAVFVQKLDKSVDVWLMADPVYKHWAKKFSVPPVNNVATWVKCWEDGEFLVSNHNYEYSAHCRELFLYDPWSNTRKKFPKYHPHEESRAFEAYLYEESLLSPLPSSYITSRGSHC